MGTVLQDTHLFSGTVRDNIRYGNPTATQTEVENAAKLACAHDFITRLPQGYDTPLQKPESGITYAKAWQNRPSLLLPSVWTRLWIRI